MASFKWELADFMERIKERRSQTNLRRGKTFSVILRSQSGEVLSYETITFFSFFRKSESMI